MEWHTVEMNMGANGNVDMVAGMKEAVRPDIRRSRTAGILIWGRMAGMAVPVVLAGCAATDKPLVPSPVYAAPQMSAQTYVERSNTGAIFQPGMAGQRLFSSERRPRQIGDTLKVDISEKLVASRQQHTETSRDNKVATKGPGSGGGGNGLLKKLLNLNASASGSDAYNGKGNADNRSEFSGQLAASVINVLPNGHLVVAGERSVAHNGGVSTLRFAGVIDPRDIQPGNVVASADVVNAKVELTGQGELDETGSRTWLQRFLTDTLRVW
jgi:flagellar L-ring protein precursor FlgH